MNAEQLLNFYFPPVKLQPDEAVVIAEPLPGGGWRHTQWAPGALPKVLDQHYFCISTVRLPARGPLRRRNEDLVRTWLIGLDDIGTKVDPALVPVQPTTKLETSQGNWQWFYKLSEPADPVKAAALIKALIRAGYSDKGAHSANRVFRLPGSVNRKRPEQPFSAAVLS